MVKNARHASAAVLLRRTLAIVPLLILVMLMFAVSGACARATGFEDGIENHFI